MSNKTRKTLNGAVVAAALVFVPVLRGQTVETGALQQQSQCFQDYHAVTPMGSPTANASATLPDGFLKDEPSQLLKGSLSTAFVSQDVRSGGSVIGKGAADQTTAKLDVGENFSLAAWLDHSLHTGNVTEVDLCANVHSTIPVPGAWTAENSPFSGGASLRLWNYPNGSVITGGPDVILSSSVTYKGVVDAELTFLGFLNGGRHGKPGDSNIDLDLTRRFSLGGLGKLRFYGAPTLRIGDDNNWLGASGVFITPGATLIIKNRQVELGAYVRRQESLAPCIKNVPVYGGVEIKLSF